MKSYIRPSAAAAFRVVLYCLVIVAAILPLQVAIQFIRGKQVDFELPLVLGGVFGVGWYIITFVSTFLDLRRLDRIQAARNPEFPARMFFAGVCGILAIGSLRVVVGLYQQHEPMWLQLLPLMFVALSTYCWPRTIRCDDLSISQRNRWGLTKTIPYSSIEAISVGHDGIITVLSAEGAIEHTPYHVDPESFCSVVSMRSGKSAY